MEIWKTIDAFPNYSVSNEGRVRKDTTGKILVATPDSRGYPALSLKDETGWHTKPVHRLVAKAFIDNPYEKRSVNHIDGNKSNNHISNLEWITDSENMLHAYTTGLKHRPDYAGSPKVAVRIVETGEVFSSVGECARVIGGDQAHIFNCLSGRYRTHRGYHYEYV